MKNKLNLTFSIFSFFLAILCGFAQSSSPNDQNPTKKIDAHLVGIWEGTETDKQVKGITKSWKMTRKNDGTFTLLFKTTQADETEEHTETGTWWVDGDKFHEFHDVSGDTDIYKYTVLNEKEVKFEMVNTAVQFNEPAYSFIDKKTAEITIENTKDGLAIENAIAVKSVIEEYQYIKNNCSNCKLLGQSLLFNNKKPYDQITVTNEKGEKVSYYFDISSFFGKW